MANVAFKRGLAANLPSAGNAVDGVFYLTTDTNRLYVGNADKNVVDLNRYIKVVNSTAMLYPSTGVTNEGLAAGDFVWVSGGNMLLVCVDPKGTTLQNTWTQINPPDTDSDTKVTGLGISDTVDAANNKITITLTLDQTTTAVTGGKTYTSPSQKTASIELTKAELDSVLDHSVGIAPSAITGGGAKITPNGSGSNANEFVNLKPGENITITVSGDDITVAAKDTKYDLNTEASTSTGILKLAARDNTETDTITFKSGNDAIVASSDDSENITYTHKAYTTTGSDSTATDKNPAHGGKFTVIDGITADKGHVTGYTTKEITLPSDNNTTYAISALTHDNKAKVRLTAGGTGSGTDDVVFAAGEDLTVAAAKDVVTYTHKDYGDLSASPSAQTDKTPAHGGSFLVVDGITASNGHITGYTTKSVKLPTDLNTKNSEVSVSVGANESGGNSAGSVVVSVKDSDGNTKIGRADNVLYQKITVDGTEKTVYNQGSLGSFYSASKIDEKLNAVNAMTYKGTVGTGATVTTLPTSGVKVGDTYKVATKGTHGGHSCDVGDLLIATGTETNGVISSGLTWTYVPSGDDTDTQHNVSVVDGNDLAEIVLGNNTGAATTKVTVKGGTAVNIDGDEANDIITVSHEDVGRTDGTSTAVSPAHGTGFTVVDAVETNAQGHVTSVKTKTVNLPTDNNTTYSISAVDVDGDAQAKLRLTASGSGSGNDDVVFAAGDGLTVGAAGDVITFAHESVDTNAEDGTENGGTIAHGTNFSVISDVKVNDRGHVTGLVTKTYTLPTDNNTKYNLGLQKDHKIALTNTDDSVVKAVSLTNTDGYITLTDTVADNKISIDHLSYTATTLGSTVVKDETLAHGGALTAVVGVTRDSGGHITGVKTRKWTLPGDNNTTYSLSGQTTAQKTKNTAVTITSTLTASNPTGSSNAAFDLTTSSLQMVAGTKSVAIDLVWGSF